MSSPRIALVAEGPTDHTVIGAAIEAVLGHGDFLLNMIQPEASEGCRQYGGRHGAGWRGVLGWCGQMREEFGSIADSPVYLTHDYLIVHVDADIAGEPETCPRHPCPPAKSTTDGLRELLLSISGDASLPPNTVLCIPAQATEAWVLAALYPADRQGEALECLDDPAAELARKGSPRLVRHRQGRLHKERGRYLERREDIRSGWSHIVARCPEEGGRFHEGLQRLFGS